MALKGSAVSVDTKLRRAIGFRMTTRHRKTPMSSARIQISAFPRTASAIAALLTVLLLMAGALPGDASAAKSKKSASATKRLPTVTRVSPMDVTIGGKVTISGKYIVKGTNKMRVLFQRVGSTRRFSARAKGLSTKSLQVTVPNAVATDLPGGTPAIFRVRLISKYGTSKAWSKTSISPTIGLKPLAPGEDPDTGPNADCDKDGQLNGVDVDDDNDLLSDVTEVAIGTKPCLADTDEDEVSDYYEHRVALEWNNGLADRIQVLPYPMLLVYPNPTVPDSDNDLDGDKLSMLNEFTAWRYTGRMDRFYSDADQDSDGDGTFDDREDEDSDLLPNIVELIEFQGQFPLGWLKTDSDGDGLCDGLDDQDQDGPPTAVSTADCTTAVPNVPLNGAGDPNPLLIDGDDNQYSNYYEWAYNGALSWYDPCLPSSYPTSPSCPHL